MNCYEYDELVESLYEHVIGINADTAAVDLIAHHGVWLHRADFAPFLQHGRCHATHQPVAMIRWRAAHTALQRGQLPCSGSEADVLRISASLGAAIPISLRHVLGTLDHRNIAHVMRAIGIANDTWPIHQPSETIGDY
jgi:hypothetical protein